MLKYNDPDDLDIDMKRNMTHQDDGYIRHNKKSINMTKEERDMRNNTIPSVRSILDRIKFNAEFDFKSLNLSNEERDIYWSNPHIRQVWTYLDTFHISMFIFK